jgi:adenylate cyclase
MPDNTLSDPKQLIADLQRQLSECKAERDEALQRETATAEVLQVINSSPGNLAPIFDAILEKALRICGATFGMMHSHDNGRLRRVADRGLPAAYNNWRVEYPLEIPSIGYPPIMLQQVLAGKTVVHEPDLMASEAYRQGNPTPRAFVHLAGARSAVTVALRNNDALQGTIMIFRQEVQPFLDKEVRLLQNFAAQAVIAIENARLLTETREALEQQTATSEVLRVISSSPGELDSVFNTILENATRICGAKFGSLVLKDGDAFRFVAMYNAPLAYVELRQREPLIRPNPNSAMERALATRQATQIADLTEHPTTEDPDRRNFAALTGARTLVIVPMLKDDDIVGLIIIYRKEVRPFTDKQIALLQNFAAQAVIAVENARLLSELRQRTDQVAELNRGLETRVAEQVEELGRVGRLKRFLAPQLAELIVSQGNEKILESHRREIVVVFCDLRGYTAFAETAEPEEVLDFLREYHGALGPLVAQFEGTLEQFSGDGITVFFNDPVPCPDPAERAVKMAVAMREAAGALIAKWRRRGRELGFGAGIAQGYATLGQIGFAEHVGYAAIGTVCNLAARLCAEAKDGQILVAQRVAVTIEETTVLEEMGSFALKGLTKPVSAFNVLVPGSGATASPPSK